MNQCPCLLSRTAARSPPAVRPDETACFNDTVSQAKDTTRALSFPGCHAQGLCRDTSCFSGPNASIAKPRSCCMNHGQGSSGMSTLPFGILTHFNQFQSFRRKSFGSCQMCHFNKMGPRERDSREFMEREGWRRVLDVAHQTGNSWASVVVVLALRWQRIVRAGCLRCCCWWRLRSQVRAAPQCRINL